MEYEIWKRTLNDWLMNNSKHDLLLIEYRNMTQRLIIIIIGMHENSSGKWVSRVEGQLN